ncbi:cytochrome c biogenesis protein [Acetonema longum]|uniref:Heme exporter protein C n=1 Tax=Acetonema longum DSM 6540 TaxID=1009370 RepID=F7NED8_9FIRM|nr:cytochrome c biogenesis protein [Acetonema longum]EGO65650.1 cytochrome c assembly protein [Acetonema longum DSM 6540]
MWRYGLAIWTAVVIWAVFYLVPPAEGLGELVRIAYFHIPVAWVSVLAFFAAAWWACRYLKSGEGQDDQKSAAAALLGFVFCLLATVSGAVFAKLTWGAYWNWDPRQTTIFVLLLIYGAYLVLRASLEDEDVRARISSVYALLSVVTVPFLVFVIPRFYASLHPEPIINRAGNLDMDPVMLYVLLAAVIACSGIFFWLVSLIASKQKLSAVKVKGRLEG